jgi:hypothetical protein
LALTAASKLPQSVFHKEIWQEQEYQQQGKVNEKEKQEKECQVPTNATTQCKNGEAPRH